MFNLYWNVMHPRRLADVVLTLWTEDCPQCGPWLKIHLGYLDLLVLLFNFQVEEPNCIGTQFYNDDDDNNNNNNNNNNDNNNSLTRMDFFK